MEFENGHVVRHMSEKYPHKLIREYFKILKDSQIIGDSLDGLSFPTSRNSLVDSARDSVMETSWDNWDAKSLAKTLTVLASQSQEDQRVLLENQRFLTSQTETDICKPFAHPKTGKIVRGYYELDTNVVEIFGDQLTPIPTVYLPEEVLEADLGVGDNVALRGVSAHFGVIESHVYYCAMLGVIKTSCNEHSNHSYIVNIHRSTDWELYESCFPLDPIFASIDSLYPYLEEEFEDKIKSIASPQSKYSQTKRGTVRDSTVLCVNQKSVDKYNIKNEWGSYSYKEGYMKERKLRDSFYFFEILIVHSD